MRLRLRGFVLLLAAVSSLGQARVAVQSPEDALARARALYNARKYDEAVAAADAARAVPALANAALVVGARARLERYRALSQPADLADARDALKLVYVPELAPRDRVEFLIALGESLYLDGCAGGCLSAAAELFEEALARSASAAVDQREAIFEWWAISLEGVAQSALDTERPQIYARILAKAEAEVRRPEGSATASYWLAAAARGAGHFERAWGAAIAAWVRSRYLGARGGPLREDLDQFVIQVLLPERARQLTPPEGDPRFLFEALVEQWEGIKRRWG